MKKVSFLNIFFSIAIFLTSVTSVIKKDLFQFKTTRHLLANHYKGFGLFTSISYKLKLPFSEDVIISYFPIEIT